MGQILELPSRSLKELRLLPRFTPADGGMGAVSLASRLCRSPGGGSLRVRMPFVSAAMQAVTGREMAVAIAQLGGIGVLPVSQSVEAQCESVAAVHRFKAGFQTDIRTLAPSQPLREVVAIMRDTGYSRFPVTDTGLFHGRLLGVLSDKDFDPRRDLDFHVADRMRKDVQAGVEVDDLDEANRLMVETGRGFLPIVTEEGTLAAVVFKKDRDKHRDHPFETVGPNRQLRVAAAISTHPEDRERIQALLAEDVDVLAVDASDGHTAYQAEAIAFVKSQADVPLIAGNVVTGEGFDFLVAAGADAVKVGMGVGSGCTTQEVKATGRGQASAIAAVARARDRHAERSGESIPIIADGSIAGPADAVLALALGADTVMLGNLLARYAESPGAVVRGRSGDSFKEYWMEGSLRAANARRYAQARSSFFEEGIEGWVPYEGSIYDGLPALARALRSAMATAGCGSIEDLHAHAVLEWQSQASLQDGAVRGMHTNDV